MAEAYLVLAAAVAKSIGIYAAPKLYPRDKENVVVYKHIIEYFSTWVLLFYHNQLIYYSE